MSAHGSTKRALTWHIAAKLGKSLEKDGAGRQTQTRVTSKVADSRYTTFRLMTASFMLHKVSRFLPVPEVTCIGKKKILETIVKFDLNTTGPIVDITGGVNGTDNVQTTSICPL